jgi:ABC-type iron transport system FetAB permease component
MERAMFFASTFMSVGNRTNLVFWEDRWLDGRAVIKIARAVLGAALAS